MKSNKSVKAMLETIELGVGLEWIEVSHAKFHETFNINKAKIWESCTDTTNNYALSVFTINGVRPTHKTVHNNGVNKMPNFYIKSWDVSLDASGNIQAVSKG